MIFLEVILHVDFYLTRMTRPEDTEPEFVRIYLGRRTFRTSLDVPGQRTGAFQVATREETREVSISELDIWHEWGYWQSSDSSDSADSDSRELAQIDM